MYNKIVLFLSLILTPALGFANVLSGSYAGFQTGESIKCQSDSLRFNENFDRIFVGYDVTKNFGLEGGFLFIPGSSFRDTFNFADVSAKVMEPITANFAIHAKVGVGDEYKNNGSYANWDLLPIAALGFDYNLDNNISVSLDVSHIQAFKSSSVGSNNFLMAGLRYKLG